MAEKTRSDLPYETYERLTGKKWTGGASASVKSLLDRYGITAPAGSEQANNALQRALKRDKTLTEDQPLAPMTPMTSSKRDTTPAGINMATRPASQANAFDRLYGGLVQSGQNGQQNVIQQFSPEDFKRINNALKAAAAIYGTGAGLGVAGGLAAGAAGEGLAASELSPYVQSMRNMIARGERQKVMEQIARIEAEIAKTHQAATALEEGATQRAARALGQRQQGELGRLLEQFQSMTSFR